MGSYSARHAFLFVHLTTNIVSGVKSHFVSRTIRYFLPIYLRTSTHIIIVCIHRFSEVRFSPEITTGCVGYSFAGISDVFVTKRDPWDRHLGRRALRTTIFLAEFPQNNINTLWLLLGIPVPQIKILITPGSVLSEF